MDHLVKIHAEAKSDDGGLQKKFCEALAFDVKRMRQDETIE
jgi:hypothetical protein